MENILTVSQLNFAIKQRLESHFLSLSVKGEISNFKESSGHLYFTLKDAQSQISGVLFKGNARLLNRLPKNGDQVVVKGELSVYPPRGQYQLVVRELSYAGVGELLLKLHETKLKLEAMGWFDVRRKKPLPKYPQIVGVITSATGSVIQDIIHVLDRRFPGCHVILYPVAVQGETAAKEIAQAIEQCNRFQLADVLIVGRGGGSLEDLFAFNEEQVVEAIVRSSIPIVSAVGHETDYSLSDFAADKRAPTPSAAAEIVMPEKAQQLHFLQHAQMRLKTGVHTRLSHAKKQLQGLLRHPYLCTPLVLLEPHLQRMDHFTDDLEMASKRMFEKKRLALLSLERHIRSFNPQTRIAASKQNIAVLERSIVSMILHHIHSKQKFFEAACLQKRMDHHLCKLLVEKRSKLTQLASHLKAIDPKHLLTKGYCILFQEKIDSVILSTSELFVEQRLRILMQDGSASVSVTNIQPL